MQSFHQFRLQLLVADAHQKKIIPLPDSVYEIDTNNVLQGFKSDFLNNPDSEIYKDKLTDCNSIIIPARVTSIADNAFYDNPQSGPPSSKIPSFIAKLTFADGSNCSTIGRYSFSRSSLTSATLPDSLTTISNFAFFTCEELTSVKFSSSLQSIGQYALCVCNLTSLDLSKCINLTSIGSHSFEASMSLHSVTFPGSLQSIGEFAFMSCSSLEEIIWNNLNSAPTIEANAAFYDVANTGHVKSTGSYTSSELLSLLKENGLPDGWEVAKD